MSGVLSETGLFEWFALSEASIMVRLEWFFLSDARGCIILTDAPGAGVGTEASWLRPGRRDWGRGVMTEAGASGLRRCD